MSLAEMITRTEKETVPLHMQTITIFGDYGTGKTSIAAGNKQALYYDLEDSAVEHEVDRFPAARTWAEFTKVLAAIWKGDTSLDGRTIVIDTVTDLWKLCERHNLAARGLEQMPRDDYGRCLRETRDDFESALNTLLMLRTKRRMGTILIAHEDVEEIETDTHTIRNYRPKVQDKHVRMLISAKPQLVLRTFKADEHPVTLKPFDNPPKFLVAAKPLTANICVKDRSNKLPALVSASWDALEKAYNKE
jgi:hypothetical protein